MDKRPHHYAYSDEEWVKWKRRVDIRALVHRAPNIPDDVWRTITREFEWEVTTSFRIPEIPSWLLELQPPAARSQMEQAMKERNMLWVFSVGIEHQFSLAQRDDLEKLIKRMIDDILRRRGLVDVPREPQEVPTVAGNGGKACYICFVNEPTWAPECGHIVCRPCLDMYTNQPCPVCKKTIKPAMKIFL